MFVDQRLFQFQVVTDTPKEVEQFMKEVEAFDVSVEGQKNGLRPPLENYQKTQPENLNRS